jgi:hypothetical protein
MTPLPTPSNALNTGVPSRVPTISIAQKWGFQRLPTGGVPSPHTPLALETRLGHGAGWAPNPCRFPWPASTTVASSLLRCAVNSNR